MELHLHATPFDSTQDTGPPPLGELEGVFFVSLEGGDMGLQPGVAFLPSLSKEGLGAVWVLGFKIFC